MFHSFCPRLEACSFSGLKVLSGHGIRFVPCVNMQTTRLVLTFISRKARSLYDQRVNPRKVAWTAVYRRAHKKVHRLDYNPHNE